MKRYSKKMTRKTIALTLAMMMLPSSAVFAANDYGDVDVDKNITANDAALALQYALDSDITIKGADFTVADVDSTEGIDANDASWIMTKALNNSVKFSVATKIKDTIVNENVSNILKDAVEDEVTGDKVVEIKKETVISTKSDTTEDKNAPVMKIAPSTSTSGTSVSLKSLSDASVEKAKASISSSASEEEKAEIVKALEDKVSISMPPSVVNENETAGIESVENGIILEAPAAGVITLYANEEGNTARGISNLYLVRKGSKLSDAVKVSINSSLSKFNFNVSLAGTYYLVSIAATADTKLNIFGLSMEVRAKDPENVTQDPEPEKPEVEEAKLINFKFEGLNGTQTASLDCKPSQNVLDVLDEQINSGEYDEFIADGGSVSEAIKAFEKITINGMKISSDEGWARFKELFIISDETAFNALKPIAEGGSEEERSAYTKAFIGNLRKALVPSSSNAAIVKENIQNINIGSTNAKEVSLTVNGKTITDFKEIACFFVENVCYADLTLEQYQERFGNDAVLKTNGRTITITIVE